MDMRRLVGRKVLWIRKKQRYELSVALDVNYLDLLKPDVQSKREKE